MQQLESLAKSLFEAKKTIRAGAHKLRLKMLQYLQENPRSTVTSIYVCMRLEQSVASQHLAILRQEGYVKAEREGKFIYYSVNEQRLSELQTYCDAMRTVRNSKQKAKATL